MLELVECECIATQINNTCLNKEIVRVVQGFTQHKFAFFQKKIIMHYFCINVLIKHALLVV